MRVDIDEPRYYNQPGCINLSPGPRLREHSNGRDAACKNSYIRPKPGIARSVKDAAASNEYVVNLFAFRQRLCVRASCDADRQCKAAEALQRFYRARSIILVWS